MEHRRILDFIDDCRDPGSLRELIKNCKARGAAEVERAAFRRLVEILPAAEPGSVEHDFWRTVHAFEQVLSEERGRTTRLGRTRQKVARVGVSRTLRDWALSAKPTDGFHMLIARGMHDMLGETIVLRHPDHFEEDVLSAARRRLREFGVPVADASHA